MRRLVPAALAFRLIDLYAAVCAWRGNQKYLDAVDFAGDLLKHTHLRGQEDQVAKRLIAEVGRSVEIFWRPWLMNQGVLEGAEHLQAARAAERGIVATFAHFGTFYSQFPIMRRYGIEAWVIAPPRDLIPPGYLGAFARQGWRYIDQIGADHVIVRPGTFDRAAAVLRDGGLVSVAFDIEGHMPTPFLGRTVHLPSGTSQLACATDALVLPFVMWRRGNRPLLRFERPIDSRDFASPDELQAAVARVVEGWVLERPEAVWPLQHHQSGLPLARGEADPGEGPPAPGYEFSGLA